MTGWGCVTFDRRKGSQSASAGLVVLLLALGPICARADAPTDCERSESETQFFQRQEQDASATVNPLLQTSPCTAEGHREAFTQGFQQAYKASHYLPTFGKFEMHPRIMSKIDPSRRACDSFQSQKLACCLAGYTEGETAFKKRLKTSREIPVQCQEDFARGRTAATAVCESAKSDKEICTVPPLFQCHPVCYSFGLNEGISQCIPEGAFDDREARGNLRVQFQKAYSGGDTKNGKTVSRSEARSAQ